jgi:hypothetical protein
VGDKPSNSDPADQMKRRVLIVIFAAIGWLPPAAADEALTIVTAQLNCASLPAGPDRTDCYIALSRINRQELDIAASAASRSKHIARYHKVTGQHRNPNPRAEKEKW